MQIKIGIIGIGSIGSVIAKALLKSNQNDIKYYTRSPKTAIQIEYNSKRESFPIQCESKISTNNNLDWLIICLKAYHFDDARSLFESLIRENTKVAIIRNGINLSEDIEPFTNKESILPCIIDCPVQPKENGYYWQLKHPAITTRRSDLSDEFSKLFSLEAITLNQVKDFKTATWKKLIESASIGSLLCLTGQTCHIFQDKKILDLYRSLLKEGIEVAIADGAIIDEDFEEKLILKLQQYPNEKGSSMLADMTLGNKIELDAKNGAISKVAQSYNIETPITDLFCTLIRQINVKAK